MTNDYGIQSESTSSSPGPPSDPVHSAIIEAVGRGRGQDGDRDSARRDLLTLWAQIGVLGDPLHRCTLAHYLADLYDEPAQALAWDIRALDAADATSDERAQQLHASLQIDEFYPSLHLNLADDYRRLGDFRAAATHLAEVRTRVDVLPNNAYGAMILAAADRVADAVTRGDRIALGSAP